MGGSKAFKDVGDAADKAGDRIKDSGEKAKESGEKYRGLAHDIEQVEGTVRRLAAEIDKTGNKDLIKDLDRQKRELRKLTRIQDLLPDMGEAGGEAATGFGASFVARLGPILARAPLGPVGVAIGAALAVPVVPILAAAVSGAVVGGVGIGGIVGGVALAAQDSRVQSAGKSLGTAIMGDLEESAARFVSPTIQGIGIIRSAWDDVAGDVDAVFESTARYVEPLARGVGDMFREMMPGIREAAEAAGPIFREIGEGLPRIGRALGDLFSGFADDADEGASALRAVFLAVEDGIDFVGDAVHAFAQMYRVLLDVGDAGGAVADVLVGWLPILGPRVDEGRARIAELKAALDKGGDSGADAGTKIAGGLQKIVDSAATAKIEIRSLKEILDDFAGKTLDQREASRAFEEAVDQATDSLKRNGRTLDENTPKGRANQAALDAIAKAARRQADATLAATGSQEDANAVMATGRARFIAAATAMGMSTTKARTLADSLFAIPDVDRTVTIHNKQALSAISAVQQSLGKIKDKRVGVYYTVHGDLKLPGGTQLKGFADGGPIEGLPGPRGVDSGLIAAANGEHMISAREVVGLGGHQAVEQLRAAARGERPASALLTSGAGRSGGSAGDAVLAAQIGREMGRQLAALPIVRLDSGRQADIYARGG